MFKQLAEMVNELFDDDGVVVALVDTGVDIDGGNDCELLLLPPPVSSEILASSSGSDTFSLLVFIRYWFWEEAEAADVDDDELLAVDRHGDVVWPCK